MKNFLDTGRVCCKVKESTFCKVQNAPYREVLVTVIQINLYEIRTNMWFKFMKNENSLWSAGQRRPCPNFQSEIFQKKPISLKGFLVTGRKTVLGFVLFRRTLYTKALKIYTN